MNELTGGAFCVVAIFLSMPLVRGADVNLAVLLPNSGFWPVGRSMLGAMAIATESVNSGDLLPNRTLRYMWNDTGCHTGTGLGEVISLRLHLWDSLHAIIGAGCDNVCEPVGLLATHWNLPMVSWGCQSHSLSYKDDYPTAARTVGSHEKVAPVIAALWTEYGWREGSILASTEHVWQLAATDIKHAMEEEGKIIHEIISFEAGHSIFNTEQREEHVKALEELVKHSRVMVLCAYGGDIRDIMLIAKELGLLDGNYAFITIDLSPAAIVGVNTWMGDDGRDDEAREAFSGLLNVHLLTPKTEEYTSFETEVRRRTAMPPFDQPIPDDEKIDVHAGMLHDAILLYAHALGDALEHGHNEYDGAAVANYMFNRSFSGITGDVYINENGDRYSDFAVQTVKDGKFDDFAEYKHMDQKFTIYEEMQVLFPGGSAIAPKDHPECGWDGELCKKTDVTVIVSAGVVTGFILVTVMVIGAILYRRMRREMEFNSQQLWRIKWDDLLPITADSRMGSRLVSSRTKSGMIGKSVGTLKTMSQSTASESRQVFIQTAQYKGLIVALKPLPERALNVDKSLLHELKQVISMQYPNVNQFFGLCIESPHNYMVTDYCTRGSLEDVLENDGVQLNDDFKLSFAMDICKGMEFLQNTFIGSHGHLKSSNCVVDNRWMVRVADFGLVNLRERFDPVEAQKGFLDYKKFLWTAPELLRKVNPSPEGTKKGDVYSYGIILHEIAVRGGPYSEMDKEPQAIIELVQRGIPPFRPAIQPDTCSARMRDLIEQCWNENAEQRPHFPTIRRLLKLMNKGKEINVVDNMIKMMEQYADHLEEQVSARTQELEEEKKKTDMLLFQMLPRSVAESLKLGKYVSPEAYPEATVYFSDIVGFTKIASKSAPLQVVNFLNDLYSTFDEVIDSHDVYKVETIGDAYMVVSGIPERNGNKHAGAIASMSLDILSSINGFVITHLPEAKLQLRIGLHSGPVVAGVVGLKMPRYCLFGDTVNVASRMESGGLALRIHVSEVTNNILTELGGYQLDYRGVADVKGKGSMKTFWLTGKDNFNKPLPDLSLAAPLEDHEFK